MSDKDTIVEVPLTISEINRIALLVHRDLARIEGTMVLAQRRLDDPNKTAGRHRRKDVLTLQTAPAQAAVLAGAAEAFQEALKEARARGLNV